MAKFQYNWVMAEMAKLYLCNSRVLAKRKAHKAAEATPDTPANAGSIVRGNHIGTGGGQSSVVTGSGNDSLGARASGNR